MTKKTPTNFRIDPEILEGLRAIRERDGVPVSEQARRALLAWLESKGIKVKSEKSERKRAATRRRS